jgi:hypothetical protein
MRCRSPRALMLIPKAVHAGRPDTPQLDRDVVAGRRAVALSRPRIYRLKHRAPPGGATRRPASQLRHVRCRRNQNRMTSAGRPSARSVLSTSRMLLQRRSRRPCRTHEQDRAAASSLLHLAEKASELASPTADFVDDQISGSRGAATANASRTYMPEEQRHRRENLTSARNDVIKLGSDATLRQESSRSGRCSHACSVLVKPGAHR